MKSGWIKSALICALLGTMSVCFAAGDLSLPDPLITHAGTKVTSPDQWKKTRRPEILELFRKQVYGRSPVGRPDEMRFEVIESSDTALGGIATRKQVRVHFTEDNNGPRMDMLIYLPNNRSKPVKLFLGMNFAGNHTTQYDEAIIKTDRYSISGECERGHKDYRWPAEKLIERGYGLATIFCADLDPDKFDDFKNGVHGAFDPKQYKADRPDDAWGTIGAWAWGLSRAMDYFETDNDIEERKVAVVGHSRLGKTALWAGAQDERFSMIISNNSGCTGAALSRNKKGERLKQINVKFPHWFCKNYRKYNDKEENLPVDQHQLIALIAPRPVYVASATKDAWADPEGEFLSCVNAGPVYELFGLKGVGGTQLPRPEQPLKSGHIGHHIRIGKHDMTLYDWNCYMDFADKHWDQDEGQQNAPVDADKPRH